MIWLFPQPVMAALIIGALLLTVIGVITLILLLIRDWRNGKVW